MSRERWENIRRGRVKTAGRRYTKSTFTEAMRGVSKIMDMAPTFTIPPAVTNTSWGEEPGVLNG